MNIKKAEIKSTTFHTRFRVLVELIFEDPTVTVKWRTTINAMYLYLDLCQSVMLDRLTCSFTSISLTNKAYLEWLVFFPLTPIKCYLEGVYKKQELLTLLERLISPPIWWGWFCSSDWFSVLCFLPCLSPSCVLYSWFPIRFCLTFVDSLNLAVIRMHV